ncbi:MAG: DUF4159 domain-containing protein [Gemmatimonadetes bacterium]|nr:DUF4159 domain-containing protein [Gemmatimonadota bacterium]
MRRRAHFRLPRSRAIVLAVAVLAAVSAIAGAQRGFRQRRAFIEPNPTYDGRFAFVRLRYQRYNGWDFDYPAMERNLMFMVRELTTMRPHVRESNVLDMDDPELMKWPVAYLSEPGYWVPTGGEALGLRNWLAKGGFLFVDDFYGNQWANFERSMRMVLPDAEFVRLDTTHPIFNSFYSIESLDKMSHPANPSYKAIYYGIYERNDRRRRLVAIVNYNNDIGDYMEWSGRGWYPMNMSNDAYKFATNYLVYALTH